jgi:hypothetical protein
MRRFLYRIFDDQDGSPATLFHGVDGSRKLPLDTWLQADVKPVTDGSCSTVYQSGFHVLPTRDDVVEHLGRFKHLRHRVIVRVEVDEAAGIWPKSHSRSPVLLVKRMRVKRRDWDRRERAHTLS